MIGLDAMAESHGQFHLNLCRRSRRLLSTVLRNVQTAYLMSDDVRTFSIDVIPGC
jgi:hypothetical protein